MRINSSILAIAFLAILCSCSKEDKKAGTLGIITVYGSGYAAQINTVLDEDAIIMADSTRLSGGIHKYFKGFHMLVSEKYSHLGGTIVSDVDATVFIIAATGSVPPSWTEVADSGNQDNPLKVVVDGNQVELKIYSTVAYAGKPVSIPKSKKSFCATPLAEKIIYVGE